MKCDGSFVIVINLSISLLYSQAGGFFVLNSPKSKYVGDKSNNPRLSQARDLVFLKFFYYISFPLRGKLILKQIYFNLIFSLYNIPVSFTLYYCVI